MTNKTDFSLIFLCTIALSFSGCGKPEKEAEASAISTEVKTVEPGIKTAKVISSQDAAAGEVRLQSPEQHSSYGIGYQVGVSIAAHDGVEIDFGALIAGIDDGLRGKTPRLDQETVESAFREIERREQEVVAVIEQANMDASLAFLAENSKRPGVITTETGLQYQIITTGNAEDTSRPTTSDKVEVHYHGTLMNGTVFDSSIQRGEPISFAVTGVIPGWVEALQLMSVGDKWRLYIPPALAYRSRKTGSIPANSALIFEVELLQIVSE